MTQLASVSAPSNALPPLEVERVEAPSREEFERDWVNRNRPVVVTGVADKWPAAAKWNAEYLERVAGDAQIGVHFQERGDFQKWYTPNGRIDKQMPLREFLKILTAEPPDRRYYMTEHDLSLVSKKLLADVDASRYVGAAEPKLFLGRDTCMPLHYHATTEAILCQLAGHKEVLLYSPEQWSLLYPHRWYSTAWMFSRVDGEQQVQSFTTGSDHLKLGPAESDRFPKFRRARPTVVRLAPGEILLIPVHWWHLTTCKGFQFNVSFFWRSSVSRYTFPRPGLQVCAHELLNKLKKKMRGRRSPPVAAMR